MLNLTDNQANKGTTITSNFVAVNSAEFLSYRGHTALSFQFWGGTTYNTAGAEVTINNGAITLTNNATNWVYYSGTGTALSVATGTTSAVIPDGSIALYKVVTLNNVITSIDSLKKINWMLKGDTNTLFSKRVQLINKNANFTAVLTEAGATFIHQKSDTTARTYTIPTNASVAFPIGTFFEIINLSNANVTVAVAGSDTLTSLHDGGTGNRIISENGRVRLLKVDTTAWIMFGTNIT